MIIKFAEIPRIEFDHWAQIP